MGLRGSSARPKNLKRNAKYDPLEPPKRENIQHVPQAQESVRIYGSVPHEGRGLESQRARRCKLGFGKVLVSLRAYVVWVL